MFGALLMLVPSVGRALLLWVFSPAMALTLWPEAPLNVMVSPLVSQFAVAGLFGAAFDAVFVLIAGRYVERALGGPGVAATFVAGAYAGAIARLVLTPASAVPGFGASGGLFAIVGAYLMLYGIPAGLPLNLRGSRVKQIGLLALIWTALQLAFLLATRGGDVSIQVIEPLGGLAAGVALARPLLRWRYRRA